MTVLFADVARFKGHSERHGDRVIPPPGRHLECMSREIHAHGGAVDKSIGDAVMAIWDALPADTDHAINACRAALACPRAIRTLGLTDDHGRPLRVRIGVNSGGLLVGNIGFDVRLNDAVIGDAVKIARRLEGINKHYGTEIIIDDETSRLAGDRIHVRELDRLTVDGRKGGIEIYELLGMARDGSCEPSWVSLYRAGLTAYRDRKFAAAIGFFQMLLVVREVDRASHFMIERCRRLLETPPGEDWEATTAMEIK